MTVHEAVYPRSDDLLSSALGTVKRIAITGLLVRRATETPDERFTQTEVIKELAETGKKIHSGDASPLFRLFESYNLLDRNRAGFGIVQGESQDSFWRAARLIIDASEALKEEYSSR